MDEDFVMRRSEKELFCLPITENRSLLRLRKKQCPITQNGERGISKRIELASSPLLSRSASKVNRNCYQNQNENKTCRNRTENITDSTMSCRNQNEFNEEFRINSEQRNLKNCVTFQKRKLELKNCEKRHRVKKTKNNTKPNIHNNKISKFLNEETYQGETPNTRLKTNNKTLKKTQKIIFSNNDFGFSSQSFLASCNLTRFKIFFFVLFIGCFIQCAFPSQSEFHTYWSLPCAEAKAVFSPSKIVLVTDVDPKQELSIRKTNPSLEESLPFNDFPDVDPGETDKSDTVINNAEAAAEDNAKLETKKRQGTGIERNKQNKESLDEYEAYDDSVGNEKVDAKSDSKSNNIKNRGKEDVEKQEEFNGSDKDIIESIEEEGEEEEEEEEEEDYEDDEDDEEENWASDMSSQPLFVPPGMDRSEDNAKRMTGKPSNNQESLSSKPEEEQHINREIPEYMLKLYQKFTQKHYTHPASDTVRSFSNINDDLLFNITNENELPGAKTRNHTLMFNISSFPHGEQINLAQLRLYKLVERDRNTYVGDDRKVSLYDVIPQDDGAHHLKLVSQKHIYGRNSGWESFDVTPAVRRWVAEIENGAVQMLEVTIESIFNNAFGNDVDISTVPRNKKEPLLVVFSKQVNKRLVHQQERDELLQHDMTLSDIEDVENFTTTEPPSTLTSVNEDDQLEREAEDPFNEDPYSSLDEVTSYAKVTQNMRSGREDSDPSKLKIRVKRSKASSKRNICRRTKLEVDFRDIQDHDWIVAPKKYQAFECSGKCYFPLGNHLRPTKHAMIRANLHVRNKKVTRPCCVPTKLDSISLLYLDSKTNGYTFKYKFEGMKVVECGCR